VSLSEMDHPEDLPIPSSGCVYWLIILRRFSSREYLARAAPSDVLNIAATSSHA
jgi:hypothetical protein